MTSPSSLARHPADALSPNLPAKYRAIFARSIKNAVRKVAKVLFGCNHRNPSRPYRNQQTCLDCGATRSYLLDDTLCAGDTAIWKGAWRKANHHFSAVVPEAVLEEAEVFCCWGVDVPGVGRQHSVHCPHRAIANMLIDEALESPPSLRRLLDDEPPADLIPRDRDSLQDQAKKAMRRDDLLDKLRFSARNLAERNSADADLGVVTRCDDLLAVLPYAARDLAQRNLRPGDVLAEYDGNDIRTAGCTECFMSEHLGKLIHTPLCKTGRVLRIIDDLLALYPAPGKETAPGEETGTGGGVRPCGLNERVCMKCGQRGGKWTEEIIGSESEPFDVSVLGLNQCVRMTASERKLLLTHHCEAREPRGLDVMFADKTDRYEERIDAAKGGAR